MQVEQRIISTGIVFEEKSVWFSLMKKSVDRLRERFIEVIFSCESFRQLCSVKYLFTDEKLSSTSSFDVQLTKNVRLSSSSEETNRCCSAANSNKEKFDEI